LSQIAEALSVHPSYLSRAFKKALGMTLTTYINKLRIEEAKYLFEQADASVTQVALATGYTDPNYFSKVFTKLEHVTPHDYRKRNQGAETLLQEGGRG
jgi:two-component system response regulator YesN